MFADGSYVFDLQLPDSFLLEAAHPQLGRPSAGSAETRSPKPNFSRPFPGRLCLQLSNSCPHSTFLLTPTWNLKVVFSFSIQPPCSYPQLCHICLSIPTGRSLLDGLLATRSVLPTHTSDRGTDHSESHLYSHVRTSSAKGQLLQSLPQLLQACQGSRRQHLRRSYDLREALRPVHCYVSPVMTWHLLRSHKTHMESHRIPPIILPDGLPPSDCNSPHREKESGIYLKVSFHPEARSLS